MSISSEWGGRRMTQYPTGHYVSHSASPLFRERREKTYSYMCIPFSNPCRRSRNWLFHKWVAALDDWRCALPIYRGPYILCVLSGFLSFQTISSTPSTPIPEHMASTYAHANRLDPMSHNQRLKSHFRLLRLARKSRPT